ncbi:hypothetical protein D9M72_649620 [compost metagenome]
MATKKLSTGHPSTLGSYLDICNQFGLKGAAAFFEKKVADSPLGRDEEILTDESQMMQLIASLSSRESAS